MAQLYILSQAYNQAIALYNEAETEEEQHSALELLQQIEEPFEEKVDNICKILTDIKAEEEAYKVEIARLQAHARSASNRYENLKGYLKAALENSGLPEKKVKTELFSVRIQANPPSVQVHCDPSELPSQFRIVIPVQYQADKKAILEAHKQGLELPETVSIERGTHILIS